MVWNWLRRHPALVDVALVAGLLAVNVGSAARNTHAPIGVALALLATLPLLFRRRWPIAVLAWTVGATVALTELQRTFLPFAIALALYTVAAHCDRRRALIAGGATLALMLGPALHDVGYTAGPAAGRLVVFVVAWLIGDSLRSRRAYTAALEEKAERLEREREANERRAAAEEQARIARELHDVIAHSVSVMVVQAAAANDVFESHPARAREAVRSIEQTGRAALTELRRLLGIVRAPDDEPYEPQPGLDRLGDLLERVRGAGLAVALRIEGEPRPLPAAVDLSAYRVVQEALTNTLKHADASRADVAVRYADGELAIEIRDDGSGAEANGETGGHGLIGMRERVGMFGGDLVVGPAGGGGFAVAARFPLEAAS
jgi:signal transduction histidine kinase